MAKDLSKTTATVPIVCVKVDVGQIEGAFVMGLGMWTSEEIKFDPTTGDLLTKNTWVRGSNS